MSASPDAPRLRRLDPALRPVPQPERPSRRAILRGTAVTDDTAVFTGSLSAAVQYPDATVRWHWLISRPCANRATTTWTCRTWAGAWRSVSATTCTMPSWSVPSRLLRLALGIDVAFDHHGTHYAHSAGHTTDACSTWWTSRGDPGRDRGLVRCR